MRRAKSKYDPYFELDIKTKATCKKCGAVIQRPGGSTYGMKIHLKSKHDIAIDEQDEEPKNFIPDKPKQTNTLDNFVQRESLEEIVSREASQLGATFRYLAKSPTIRKGLTLSGHQDKAPRSHPTVQRLVHKSAEKHRENVRLKLKRLVSKGQRFCVVCDEWTCSSKRRRYINVKLHIKGKIIFDISLCLLWIATTESVVAIPISHPKSF